LVCLVKEDHQVTVCQRLDMDVQTQMSQGARDDQFEFVEHTLVECSCCIRPRVSPVQLDSVISPFLTPMNDQREFSSIGAASEKCYFRWETILYRPVGQKRESMPTDASLMGERRVEQRSTYGQGLYFQRKSYPF
jgi:hypothetical protein